MQNKGYISLCAQFHSIISSFYTSQFPSLPFSSFLCLKPPSLFIHYCSCNGKRQFQISYNVESINDKMLQYLIRVIWSWLTIIKSQRLLNGDYWWALVSLSKNSCNNDNCDNKAGSYGCDGGLIMMIFNTDYCSDDDDDNYSTITVILIFMTIFFLLFRLWVLVIASNNPTHVNDNNRICINISKGSKIW